MNSMTGRSNQKGETSANFMWLGFLIILAAVNTMAYLQTRSGTVTAHSPQAETR
jgi:hypothetical protein